MSNVQPARENPAKRWEQSPQTLIDLFSEVAPGPPAEVRKMFGYPCAFVNGNMFMGLHQSNMILRLAEDARNAFLEIDGADLFEPMPGRPMREYVVVPASLLANRSDLDAWVEESFKYALTLPPKEAKKAPRKRG